MRKLNNSEMSSLEGGAGAWVPVGIDAYRAYQDYRRLRNLAERAAGWIAKLFEKELIPDDLSRTDM